MDRDGNEGSSGDGDGSGSGSRSRSGNGNGDENKDEDGEGGGEREDRELGYPPYSDRSIEMWDRRLRLRATNNPSRDF